MQSKVARMNGKTGSSPVKNDEGAGSSKTLSNASNSSKDLPFTKNALILAFFVVTVLVGYLLPDGPSKITYLGLTVIAVFHIYVIVIAFLEKKIGKTTIFLAKAWFILLVVGWFFPEPIWQAWKDVKGWRDEHKDQPYHLFGDSSQKQESTTLEKRGNYYRETVTVPIDSSITVIPPAGYRLSSMACPAKNVVDIVDQDTKEVTRQLDCADRVGWGELMDYEILNKEFVIFPKEGVLVPSTTKITWVKI